jgi:hypothetical protein
MCGEEQGPTEWRDCASLEFPRPATTKRSLGAMNLLPDKRNCERKNERSTTTDKRLSFRVCEKMYYSVYNLTGLSLMDANLWFLFLLSSDSGSLSLSKTRTNSNRMCLYSIAPNRTQTRPFLLGCGRAGAWRQPKFQPRTRAFPPLFVPA